MNERLEAENAKPLRVTRQQAEASADLLNEKQATIAQQAEENARLIDNLETSGFSPFTEEAEDILRARVKTLESAIERMRVAGGREEFQMAFDLAKDLLK